MREFVANPDDDGERSYPPDEATLRAFYRTPEWLRLAYETKGALGWQCQCCGAAPDTGGKIVSDHIRPARFYWHLRLERSNVAVLCDECNLGKGSWDTTDFRAPPAQRLLAVIKRCIQSRCRSELKTAIITAHSYGALSQEESIRLISEHRLSDA